MGVRTGGRGRGQETRGGVGREGKGKVQSDGTAMALEEVKKWKLKKEKKRMKRKKAVEKTDYFLKGKGLELASLGSRLWNCQWIPEENNNPSLSLAATPLYGT